MPTSYSYLLGTPGSPAIGDRFKQAYAFTPRFDPKTRDFVMRGSTFDAGSPALEWVLLTLATPLGSYLPDPTLGPDYRILDKLRTNLASLWKASVVKALARGIPARIAEGTLEVEVDPPARGKILYSVAFTDARSGEKIPRQPLVAFVG